MKDIENKIRIILILLALALMSFGGCTFDMNVVNNNEPDRDRALATPGDVEELIASSFIEYFYCIHSNYPSVGLSTMADEKSGSWGSYGMRDLSSEPRTAWNNSPTYSRRRFTKEPWDGNYTVISKIYDALYTIYGGMDLGSPGSTDTGRAVAFGKFCQGLSYCYLGLFFDKAAIADAGINNSGIQPDFIPYGYVIAHGIGLLTECIEICSTTEFTLPPTWINGLQITNHDLSVLCHSFIARTMVMKARTDSERQSTDWLGVLYHIENGVTEDFAPEGDDELWWHPEQYSSNWNGWYVADNKLHGPSDTSENYSNWLNTPVEERTHFLNHSTDKRLTLNINVPGRRYFDEGKYFYYQESQSHYALRGTYHWSRYRFHKFDYQYPQAYGPMPELTIAEMDLLKAEAYLRGVGGTKADVAELINKTRISIGEMEPLTGGESDLELWRWLSYEKRMETHLTGIAFFDYRGWAGLTVNGERVIHVPAGTPVHFPVPGEVLELLLEDNYTFGGVGQTGGTPSISSTGNTIDSEYIKAAKERLNKGKRSKEKIPERK